MLIHCKSMISRKTLRSNKEKKNFDGIQELQPAAGYQGSAGEGKGSDPLSHDGSQSGGNGLKDIRVV